MKILFYCQHVWGVGHFFRSMEICRGLHRHDVVMAAGGPPFDAPLPGHVRLTRLPPIRMDDDYRTLRSDDGGRSLERVKSERSARLRRIYLEERPDVLLIELYPFGRRKFKFELVPLLKEIRGNALPPAKVVCSLRDILVAKPDAAAYEADVVEKLNRYFDALLIHADRRLVALDETFGRTGEIAIPQVYTGFVVQPPPDRPPAAIRQSLHLDPDHRLVLVSAGGGRSGVPLLRSVLGAVRSMQPLEGMQVLVFTGPFIEDRDFADLQTMQSPGVKISRFSDQFLSLLAVADLSISMGGYNTSMNLLATGVPALVWPFPGDREQGLRARRLEEAGVLRVLAEADLDPTRMAALIRHRLSPGPRKVSSLAMDGARETARFLETLWP